MPKISCIIPAYNEERTIKGVIDDVKKTNIFDEIIVVNDGSIDKTYEILKKEDGIIFIDLEHNIGKGGAVAEGLKKADGEIVVMLDADLMGVERSHIEKLLAPLLSGETDVCIGIIQHEKRAWMTFIQRIGSNLSGQQAFFKKFVDDANIAHTRFGIEIALKNHFKKKGARTKKIFLYGVSHLMKEQKMGIEKGLKHRGKMYKEVGKEIGNGFKEKITQATKELGE